MIIGVLALFAASFRVDQVGYEPEAAKVAMVAAEAGAKPQPFRLIAARDGKVVFQGILSDLALDPDSGQSLQAADFSAVRTTGEYYLEAPGVNRSPTFRIAPALLRRVYYLTARAFYGQRCGIAVDLGPEFPGYRHSVCHKDGAYHSSSGKSGKAASSHGWHDAGDYGRYVVNSGISTATLLYAQELYGKQISGIALDLPETGNKTPDLLNEARWNIEWMLSMQDADGGVWHKQTSAAFCGFVMPDRDSLPSLVIGSGQAPYKTSCATADLAAVTAIAGRLFQSYDPGFARRCLKAAQSAWTWLQANPALTFDNPPGVTTGAYGDKNCSDEEFWAAVELFRSSHDPTAREYIRNHYSNLLDDIDAEHPPDWGKVSALALWSYALDPAAEPGIAGEVRSRSLQAADAIVARQMTNPYRLALTRANYIWGSNGVLGNYCLQLLMANQFQPKNTYVAALRENLHYLLGRNALNVSFVTQVGSRPVMHIHHRPSAADGLDAPWPGLLAGGPNAGRQDSEMKEKIVAGSPPALAYLDSQGAYAANEVAINWQAPLVFALAALQ